MTLTAQVDCAECGSTYEGVWEDDSDTPQDLDAAPVQGQQCPSCGHVQDEQWPGWAFRSEAGLPEGGSYQMPEISRRDQLASMPRGDIVCRVLVGNHTPDGAPKVYNAPGGEYELVFTCQFCGTEVSKFRDRHGFITSRRKYGYRRDGQPYLIQDGGGLTPSEKAALFLRSVTTDAGESKGASVTRISSAKKAAS